MASVIKMYRKPFFSSIICWIGNKNGKSTSGLQWQRLSVLISLLFFFDKLFFFYFYVTAVVAEFKMTFWFQSTHIKKYVKLHRIGTNIVLYIGYVSHSRSKSKSQLMVNPFPSHYMHHRRIALTDWLKILTITITIGQGMRVTQGHLSMSTYEWREWG